MDFNGAGMKNMRTPIPKDGIPPKEFTDAVRAGIGKGIEQLLIISNTKK
jgi:hypothetical protein